MSIYAENIERARLEVNSWRFDEQRAESRLTPEDLIESAERIARGPDTPDARRRLAERMKAMGMTWATPSQFKAMWAEELRLHA